MPTQQGGIVGDRAACGIENQAAAAQAVKKRLVAQMPRGPLAVTREWRVEGDDVALALQLLEREEYVIKRKTYIT